MRMTYFFARSSCQALGDPPSHGSTLYPQVRHPHSMSYQKLLPLGVAVAGEWVGVDRGGGVRQGCSFNLGVD